MNTKQKVQNEPVRNELVVASPVGKLRLVASEKGLVAIDVRNNAKQEVTAKNPSAQAVLIQTKKQLEQYFAGKRTTFDVALDLVGTEFQVQAWRALCRIPFGKTISYGQQALKSPRHFAQLALPTARTRFLSSCRVTELWQAMVLSVDIPLDSE
jgi:methylated-DNA-[protein]-cysteine S-methyltransferase